MADEPKPPRRRLQLQLKLDADSLDALASALRCLASDFELDDREVIPDLASGGYRSGYHLTLTCDPEQNHERFAEQIEAWAAERRRSKVPDVPPTA